jgi:hypothetical protein
METADILSGLVLGVAAFTIFPLAAAFGSPGEPIRIAWFTSLSLFAGAIVLLFSGLFFSSIVLSATAMVWAWLARNFVALAKSKDR